MSSATSDNREIEAFPISSNDGFYFCGIFLVELTFASCYFINKSYLKNYIFFINSDLNTLSC